MPLTVFDQVVLGLLGSCLTILAVAAVRGTFILSEQARFERYEQVRRLLNELCRPDAPRVTRLLAMEELKRYREYSALITKAVDQAREPALRPTARLRHDILDGVVIRRRGERVKGSVLREVVRFRDAVIYR